jgi:ubiquinone/menaquinone biosynthesis C-methylase UbiE
LTSSVLEVVELGAVSARHQIVRGVVRSFADPRGLGGSAAGWIMSHRSSNVRRGRWAVDRLDVQPTDQVLELGFGPGVAIAALAERVPAGRVVGVDRSPVMLRQARRRNAAAIRAGRVQLHRSPVEDLPDGLGGPFDRVLAVNTVGFWPDPEARLRELAGRVRPGGRVALVSQPRCPGATAATTVDAGRELAAYLAQAGFRDLRSETLDLSPPVVCVLGTR